MGRYINPFTDWGFKRLFGQEFSKELLISFLNDLFEGEFHIKDVTFKDKEQLADTHDLRGCVFDIYCETDDGKNFIVEMQNRWVPYFINRSIYYASKAVVSQRKKKREDDEDTTLYRLLPVYVVCVMNYMPHQQEVTKFRTDVALREKGSNGVFSDKLRFVYLSLPFFNKEEADCKSNFEEWIYVLKHMEVLERMPFTAQRKIFKHLADLADIRCMTQEEQDKYDESRKVVDDYNSGLYGSYIIGHDEGKAEGQLSKSLEIARKMLLSGMSEEQVMLFTGLMREQLEALKS